MRKRFYLYLILSILLLGYFINPLFSQDSSTWYYGKKIRDIDFQGLKNVNESELSGVTANFIGEFFSDDLYFDLLNRIFALELFDDITSDAVPGDANGNSVIIKFSVTERPYVSSISFKGNRNITASELLSSISIKEKDIYNSSKVLLAERAIRDAYLQKGYTTVRVSSDSIVGEDKVDVVFTITEGRSTILKNVSFSGNQVVASKTLKGLLSMKEEGLFNRGSFQESQLEADKLAILAYYHNRGYVDAVILDVVRTSNYNEEDKCDELDIRFVIQEGNQYTFAGINFQGNKIFDTDTLRSMIKLADGEVFNQEHFNQGIYAITDLYYENGYTSNFFDTDIFKNAETRQISTDFIIVERPRSHIENIIISGNSKTKDHVILRELPIETGDIFSKAKVTAGLRNLFNLQFFSAIVPDIVSGSEDNLVDLIINVEEQSTTSIEFGLTFSGIADPDAFPVSLFFKWQDSNLFGSGKSLALNTEVATDNQSLTLSYSDYWLFGQPISVSVSAGLEHSVFTALRSIYLPNGTINTDDYYMNYNQLAMNFGASVGRRWIPDFAIFSLSGGISGEVLRNFYDDNTLIPVDPVIAKYQESWGMQNTVWGAFSVDVRDLNYDPSSGWFAKQRLSWTGLIPALESEFFFRSDTKAEIYFTLLDLPVFDSWNLKFVLAAFSSFSFVMPHPNYEMSTNSLLYIDGMFTGRGWTSVYSTIRKKALWNNTLELRMPVAPGVLSLDFFFDAVALKDDLNDMVTNLSIDDFYFSFGPGIRFSLQQFPLRLLWANTFQVKDGDVKWQNGDGPEWSFVLSFNITER
ncbi:MAG: outer membrane protein assembly factor BamA [Spirochaetaceae bacterium]|nr:outer membrane protein assembly factor BamA [Spirochaetaceae bacterium]